MCVGESLVEMRITPHGVPILGREEKRKVRKGDKVMKRKRNEMFKRSVAVILSVVMGIGSTPSSVFASETEWQTEVQTEGVTELQTSAGTEPAPVAEEPEVTVETNAPVVETEPPSSCY